MYNLYSALYPVLSSTSWATDPDYKPDCRYTSKVNGHPLLSTVHCLLVFDNSACRAKAYLYIDLVFKSWAQGTTYLCVPCTLSICNYICLSTNIQITIPNTTTTYWCTGFLLPEEIRRQTRYVIKVYSNNHFCQS